MLRSLYQSIVHRPAMRKLIMSTPLLRDLAWRFVAGENLESGLAALRSLNARGLQGTLNYVGTHVRTEEAATAAAGAAITALERIAQEHLASHLSLKLTQIGLDIDEAFCHRQLERVLACAKENGVFVRIDMEESPYVERTLAMFEKVREQFGTEAIGIVIQSYLRQRTHDLERVLEGDSSVRLVKGGYWEAPEVAFKKPDEIDRSFDRDLQVLLRRGRAPAIATHDPRFIVRTQDLVAESGRARSSFEFQMLYGVRPDIQEQLVREGFNVRCYVPYGGDWVTYFLGCARRLPIRRPRLPRDRRATPTGERG